MQKPDFKTWSDLIRSHSIDGRYGEVLSLFLSKVRRPFGYEPDHLVLQAALKSCAILPALNLGRNLHGFVVKLGHLSCLSVSKGLLNVYAKAKAFSDCKKLFDQMPKSDIVIWNIVLAGLSGSQIHDVEVMQLLNKMHACSYPKPSPVTVAVVLSVCARLGSLSAGKSIHSYVIKSGWASATLVGNALVSMYAKCGCVHDGAYGSFSEIDEKDVVSWNAIIAGFAENEFHKDAHALFRKMLLGSIVPNYSTIASILPVFSLLDRDVAYRLGRQLHAYTLKLAELRENTFVVNALMSFYLRMGLLENAEAMFNGMANKDLVSWNVIIGGYASNNEYFKAIRLFEELVSGQMLQPDSVTLITVLPACAHLHNLEMVKQIHGYIFQHPELCNNTTVSNALISSYAKCDDLDTAFRTFMMISERDLISWNSMFDAFAGSGFELQLVNLLHQMLEEGLGPDSITLLTLIQFYAGMSRLSKVKEVHGYLLRLCFCQSSTQPTLSHVLLEGYANCGSINYAYKIFGIILGERIGGLIRSGNSLKGAHKVFEGLCQTDLPTWNLMIRAYVENNCHEEAATLLFELQVQGVKPNAASIMSIVPMCTKMASIKVLRQCHGYVVRAYIDDIQLKGTLIDTYSKCGSVSIADKLFHSSPHKDLVMFTALIGGFAMHGMGKQAIVMFKHMLEMGIRPDHVLFTTILSACSHAGLVDEGLRIFYSIERVHGMKPTMEQYCSIVDLLARQGKVEDAYTFVTEMPVKANANIWSILLGACRTYNEVELGQIVANHLLGMEDYDIGSYVTMSNLHAADAKWDEVLETRKLIKTKDLKKPAGCSWIEIHSRKSTFIAGDSSHPEMDAIYSILVSLDKKVKEPYNFG